MAIISLLTGKFNFPVVDVAETDAVVSGFTINESNN